MQTAQTEYKTEQKAKLGEYNHKEIMATLSERAEKKIQQIDNTLTKGFVYSVKIGETDTLKVNDKTIDTENLKQNLKIFVDTAKAKDEIKKVVGLDFNKRFEVD